MAERHRRAMSQQGSPERPDQAAGQPDDHGDGVRFSAAERKRLTRLRRLVRRGDRSEGFPVDRRQEFVRWLVDRGKLSDHLAPTEDGGRGPDD